MSTQPASAPEPFGSDALPVPQACRPSRVLLVTTGPATKVAPTLTHQQTGRPAFGVLQNMKQIAIHCLVHSVIPISHSDIRDAGSPVATWAAQFGWPKFV